MNKSTAALAGGLAGTYLATAALRLPSPPALIRQAVTAPSRLGDRFPTRTVAAPGRPVPLPLAERPLPATVPWPGGPIPARRFLRLTDTNAFLVLRGDTLTCEWYRQGIGKGTRMASWSVAKSVVSLLVGQEIGRGTLHETDRLVAWLPELRGGAEGYDAITLGQLLDMTAGVDVPENYARRWPFTGTIRMVLTTDLPGFVRAHRGIEFPPGSAGAYRSVNTQLLGMVLARATGSALAPLLSARLWHPLGAEYDATWNLDRDGGTEKAFCGINATARDFARIGRLVCDGGRAGDRQVVPADWIARIARTAAHPVDGWPYSAQWWHTDDADFCAIGVHGQYVYVDPPSHTVIVKLSDHGVEQDEVATLAALRAVARS